MKKQLHVAAALVAVLIFASTAMAQSVDALQYFPKGNDIIITMDLQKILDLLPEEQRFEMIEQSKEALGYDISGKLQMAMVGMKMSQMTGGNPDVTGFLMAEGISIQDIVAAASEDGKTLAKTNIAGLEAWTDPDEEGQAMYFTQINSNMFAFGTEAALTDYVAVQAGTMDSAAAHAELKEVATTMNTGAAMSVAAVFTEEMRQEMGKGMPMFGDLTNFVVNLDSVADGFIYDAAIGATSEDSLNLMKGMIEQYIPMMKNSDTTGLAAEIIDNLNIQVEGGFLRINGKVMQSTLDKITQMAPMMMMGADDAEAELEEEEEEEMQQ